MTKEYQKPILHSSLANHSLAKKNSKDLVFDRHFRGNHQLSLSLPWGDSIRNLWLADNTAALLECKVDGRLTLAASVAGHSSVLTGVSSLDR